ncbi:hypothetical protein [Candidatus Hodarchaeum mangrovi]
MSYLHKNRYCNYKEGSYKKRQYYLSHQNITGLSIQRISYQKENIRGFLEELKKLRQTFVTSKKGYSKELLILLDQFIEEYSLLFDIYDEFLSKIYTELSGIQDKYTKVRETSNSP